MDHTDEYPYRVGWENHVSRYKTQEEAVRVARETALIDRGVPVGVMLLENGIYKHIATICIGKGYVPPGNDIVGGLVP
jgi:hypothetical protein